MSTASTATGAPARSHEDTAELSTTLWDGFMAGAVGALVVALWFLVRDLAAGEPLHTPALLATALLEGPAAVADGVEFHTGPVAIWSVIHLTLFSLFGTGVFLAARRLTGAARTGALVLALVLLTGGSYAALAALWPPVADALPAWSVVTANLLGGLGMAYYLKLRTGRVV